MEHELKTWPDFFQQVWNRRKPFEYRLNDRNFKKGDILKLKEYIPQLKEFTGREMRVFVVDIWKKIPGMPEDYCIMSIASILPPKEQP